MPASCVNGEISRDRKKERAQHAGVPEILERRKEHLRTVRLGLLAAHARDQLAYQFHAGIRRSVKINNNDSSEINPVRWMVARAEAGCRRHLVECFNYFLHYRARGVRGQPSR